jgi:putative ABC transport system permease protein
MSLWRQIAHGVRVLTRRTRADQDVADEVAHYIDEATAALIASGLPPADARRAARMQVGSVTRVRETVRDGGWENLVAIAAADLRYGARRLRASPGFASVSILTLALGIGASTAIFSAVNPILFAPLPYPHPERIVMIWDTALGGIRIDVTFATFREFTERSQAFDALAVMKPWYPTVTDADGPERLNGQRVSADYFRALGVTPMLGRTFTVSEDRVKGENAVILTHRLWQRRFGGEREIVGRPIVLDEMLYIVAGVMPASFENVLSPSAELWAPLQYDATLPPEGREWGHHLRLIGRLKPETTPAGAVQDLNAIARAPIPEFARQPWASLDGGLTVTSLHDEITRSVKPALLAVAGAVLLVLAIACVNVANLLLARGTRMRGEFAIRTALGAPRSRLIRQTLTESLLLATLGGALGLVVARIGVGGLLAAIPSSLPRSSAIAIDGTVFGFACAITTGVGLLVGLIPAVVHSSRARVHSGMQGSSRRIAGRQSWTSGTLAVAEVALALVLLVGAGLLLRSVHKLFAVPPGFEPAHLLTLQVQASGARFRNPQTAHRFFADALQQVRRTPGVAAAAWTSQLPLSGDYSKYGVQFASIPNHNPEEDRAAFRYAVSPGYFETLRIPLVRGRVFDDHDNAGAPFVVVLNESFAKRRFPGRDPIGERVRVGQSDSPWSTIIGIVGDVKQTSLALSDADAAYVPTTQWYFVDNPLWLVVRGERDAAALAPQIRAAIAAVDKYQPVVRVATMDALVAASAAEQRFALILFETFGAAALMLAAVGLYGILAGNVQERTREIGIRSALGATRGVIIGWVLRQAMSLTVLGIVIGSGAAAAASQAVATLLFGISRFDFVTYGGVVVVLLAMSVIASAVPALRAAWVDPALTLRME